MSGAEAPAFEVTGVTKQYGGLRPLRLQSLAVPRGSMVALVGLDAPAAETLVNLVTGATLPDSGEVRVFGRRTADVTDPDEWLRSMDRFGIVSDRAVLLDELTVAQNLAMTLTLEIDPIAADVRAGVDRIADDVDLRPATLDRKIATLGPAEKLRVRLGRAIALDPSVLLLEHPTATLAPPDVPAFAAIVRRLTQARALSGLVLTADAGFAADVATEAWTWTPADGGLSPLAGGTWRKVKRLFGA